MIQTALVLSGPGRTLISLSIICWLEPHCLTCAGVRPLPAAVCATNVTMAAMTGTVGAIARLTLCTYALLSSSTRSRSRTPAHGGCH